VQESIQNSLKHARCSHIYIRLEVTEQALKLGIQDDGGGFNTARPEHAGSGLRNMKKRAAILNASFSVTSSIGGGTLVLLTAPRNNLKL
jgi:two-component system, NarL family, sensor kinase